MRSTKPLLPLNGQLQIAGETFFSNQIAVDMDDRILFLRHPRFGELTITERDAVLLRFLDLEALTLNRMLQDDGGWKAMTVGQLFDLIAENNSAQEG